ncbi:MAG: OmpA family protein [Alphaproteobacteria bacterium]
MPMNRMLRAVIAVAVGGMGLAASFNVAWAENPVVASEPIILAQMNFDKRDRGDDEDKQRDEKRHKRKQRHEKPSLSKKGQPDRKSRDDARPPRVEKRHRAAPAPSFSRRKHRDDAPPRAEERRHRRDAPPRAEERRHRRDMSPRAVERPHRRDMSPRAVERRHRPISKELGLRRMERRKFTRERLKDITKHRRRVRDNRGRIVIHESGNRRIIREKGHAFIQHDDSERFRQRARKVREERSSDGYRRRVFTRADGRAIITVTDDNGRLIRRIRRDRRGREFTLFDNRRKHRRRHHGHRVGDFGFRVTLPPPVVRIPRHEYYVDASRASEKEVFFALSAPPVDDIDAEYTLDEIRYSPSLRDRFRRVSLSTINFEFGSWELNYNQIDRLEVIARAIKRILRRNPDEVFLISGHTDAVGSDEDNLSLSDRRAETVARVLTDEFNVPPENLVTQGYGEKYLLIETQEAEHRNRRVEFQRITEALARNNKD